MPKRVANSLLPFPVLDHRGIGKLHSSWIARSLSTRICASGSSVCLEFNFHHESSLLAYDASTDDIQGADIGTEDTSLLLRAERSGSGTGRIYTLTFEAEDGVGNVMSAN